MKKIFLLLILLFQFPYLNAVNIDDVVKQLQTKEILPNTNYKIKEVNLEEGSYSEITNLFCIECNNQKYALKKYKYKNVLSNLKALLNQKFQGIKDHLILPISIVEEEDCFYVLELWVLGKTLEEIIDVAIGKGKDLTEEEKESLYKMSYSLGKCLAQLHLEGAENVESQLQELKTKCLHQDLHGGNIFYDESEEKISFIDLTLLGKALQQGFCSLKNDLMGVLFHTILTHLAFSDHFFQGISTLMTQYFIKGYIKNFENAKDAKEFFESIFKTHELILEDLGKEHQPESYTLLIKEEERSLVVQNILKVLELRSLNLTFKN
jgi:tRNA A-37 threonylcarbamoyl transferase component Bud32